MAQWGGDIIKLVAHALQTDFKGAVIFCNGFLGTPPQVARLPQSAQSGFKPIVTKPRDAETRITKAKVIWGEGISIAGTLAEIYLALRSITLSPPATLRFHSGLWNHSTKEKHPALLACMQSPDGDLCGVQAVYLDAKGKKISGDGVLAKISYGCLSGGAVRLSAFSEPLILCEGLEDGLSILQAMPDACVLASCGTSGMVSVVLPNSIHKVIIASDADDAGQKAAHTLAARLKKEGRVARIATPADSKDFNELLVQGNIACLTK